MPGLDLRLERRLLEEVEEITLLDLGAFDEEPLFEKGGDPGDQRHPPHCLNAADELVGLGDLLALGPHDPDTRRRGLGCRRCGICEGSDEEGRAQPDHRIPRAADPAPAKRLIAELQTWLERVKGIEPSS